MPGRTSEMGVGRGPRGLSLARPDRRAFTLVETLVVIVIVALLLSILLPALSAVRGQMKSLKCSSNLRTTAFKFQLFAENDNPEGQGDSEALGGGRFFINDFQETLYRIDEFWDVPDSPVATLHAKNETIMCPAGARTLKKRKGFPCSKSAVNPPEDVSFAINMRFYRAPISFNGFQRLAPVAVTRMRPDVLSHAYAPLMMDVDAREATRRGIEPFYMAPPLPQGEDAYDDGRFWMPGRRHGGRTNIAFVGGHVLSSRNPELEAWDWKYQAEVAN